MWRSHIFSNGLVQPPSRYTLEVNYSHHVDSKYWSGPPFLDDIETLRKWVEKQTPTSIIKTSKGKNSHHFDWKTWIETNHQLVQDGVEKKPINGRTYQGNWDFLHWLFHPYGWSYGPQPEKSSRFAQLEIPPRCRLCKSLWSCQGSSGETGFWAWKRRGLMWFGRSFSCRVLVLVHGFLVSILLLNTAYFSYNDDSKKPSIFSGFGCAGHINVQIKESRMRSFVV